MCVITVIVIVIMHASPPSSWSSSLNLDAHSWGKFGLVIKKKQIDIAKIEPLMALAKQAPCPSSRGTHTSNQLLGHLSKNASMSPLIYSRGALDLWFSATVLKNYAISSVLVIL